MSPVTEQRIARLVDDIVAEVAPQAVYLFGSRARGEARPDADVDLLVVVARPFGPGNPRRPLLSRLWALVARNRLPADILLYSRDEVDRRRACTGHVIADALRDGKVLYGA